MNHGMICLCVKIKVWFFYYALIEKKVINVANLAMNIIILPTPNFQKEMS
jgi:hypothetical protein